MRGQARARRHLLDLAISAQVNLQFGQFQANRATRGALG
jgi:hypothetical protein